MDLLEVKLYIRNRKGFWSSVESAYSEEENEIHPIILLFYYKCQVKVNCKPGSSSEETFRKGKQVDSQW